MALATFEDANAWLDENKIGFADVDDAAPEATKAENLIKGKLSHAYSKELVMSWDESTAPLLVREAASLLMAAFRYEKKYSLEDLREDDYSARLLARANMLLDGIASGSIVLVDIEIEASGLFNRTSFWPNETTEPKSKFMMGAEF